MPRGHTGHSKHALPTTSEKTTYGRHQMISTEIRLIMFFAPEDGETIKSAKLRPGVDCSSDYSSLLQNLDLN